MKVRNLILCTLLFGASSLQANFITDSYNRLYSLYNAIIYLVSNQRIINNAINDAVVRQWSDKVTKQNGATCGFDAYKNGKWVHQFLTGKITRNGLFDYLQQQPGQTAYPLSVWQQQLRENNNLDDGQLYALRNREKGITANDFVVIPTINTFAQNIANNDFAVWTEPLVYLPHVTNTLNDIQQAILDGTRKTAVFILGNMAPEIRANNNISHADGHWVAFVVNVRNQRVTLFSLDSSQKAIIVPKEFNTHLEQINTSFKQFLKMNPKNIRTCVQNLIAQQLPNLLQDAQNYLYNNRNPVNAMNIIETIIDHYKNIIGSPAGQAINDQAGFILNMLVEIMHQAIATDNNGLAQKAAHCISAQPFADIVLHQIMDDSAKKQLVLKAHTLLVRFPQLIDNETFVTLVGTITQQYPELEQNNGQELFPSPAARVPAPCCFAPIKQEQLNAAVCPVCGSDQFAQLVRAQNQEPRPVRNSAPSAPQVEEFEEPLYPIQELHIPSLEQKVAIFKHEAQQAGMTNLAYATIKKDLDILGYILANDKPSIYTDDLTKQYVANAQENDHIAVTMKAYLLNNNLECPICYDDMDSVDDFHFYHDCAHHICKNCQASVPNCTVCT